MPFLILLTGCIDQALTPSRDRVASAAPAGSLAGTGLAYVYLQNPAVAQGENPKTSSFRIGNSLDDTPRTITDKTQLIKDCTFNQTITLAGATTPATVSNCMAVYTNDLQTPVSRAKNSWVFNSGSDEFHAVNTFYHANRAVDSFLDFSEFAHEYTHLRGIDFLPQVMPINPVLNKSFWFPERSLLEPAALKVLATPEVDSASTAFYPSEMAIYLGRDPSYPGFKMSQDPSIIYHEMAHAFVYIMLNQRNTNALNGHTVLSSEMGITNYDEALAVNEGIADYFTYLMTGRTRFGEWGAARYNAARPLSESDSMHTNYVNETSQDRVSYPDFLKYDPNDLENTAEDVHYAGQIVSHYLVALTKRLNAECSFFGESNASQRQKLAGSFVMLALSETLGELGDLRSTLTDFNVSPQTYFANLHPDSSYDWSLLTRMPDFRRFFQTFGKNIYHHISSNLCSQFDQNDSEKLLDDYGLLLFRNYNDIGMGQKFDGTQYQDYTFENLDDDFFGGSRNYNDTLTLTNELNRQKSVLVSKDLLSIPGNNSTRPLAYIFDGPEIYNYLENLLFEGNNVVTSSGLAGPEYNNDNLEISPGEIVGLSLNVINNSNSTISGLKILGNNWDHMRLADPTIPTSGSVVPCIFQDWPLSSEGGVTDSSMPALPSECEYPARVNPPFIADSMTGEFPLDAQQPTCLVEYQAENETRWVSQNDMRKSLSISDNKCLNNPNISGELFNGNECLIRFLPGANVSYLGSLDPGKTWAETIKGDSDRDVVFHAGSVVLMEVNKFLPPGTKFNCRMRASFSNCSDCFDDPDDQSAGDKKDYEYSTDRTHKVLNFGFRIGN